MTTSAALLEMMTRQPSNKHYVNGATSMPPIAGIVDFHDLHLLSSYHKGYAWWLTLMPKKDSNTRVVPTHR